MVTGNRLRNCSVGFLRAYSCERIAFEDNVGTNRTRSRVAGLAHRNSRVLTVRRNSWHGPVYDFVDENTSHERSSFWSVEGPFKVLPAMADGAPAGQSAITLGSSGRRLVWNGRAFQ